LVTLNAHVEKEEKGGREVYLSSSVVEGLGEKEDPFVADDQGGGKKGKEREKEELNTTTSY